MPELRDLLLKERAAQARIDAVMSASHGRSMTAEERQEFEAATVERDTFDIQINDLLAAEGAGQAAITGKSPPASAAGSPGHSSEARDQTLDSMRRTLKAQGLTPREDPGAGLPPAQASMARLVAMGR